MKLNEDLARWAQAVLEEVLFKAALNPAALRDGAAGTALDVALRFSVKANAGERRLELHCERTTEAPLVLELPLNEL